VFSFGKEGGYPYSAFDDVSNEVKV